MAMFTGSGDDAGGAAAAGSGDGAVRRGDTRYVPSIDTTRISHAVNAGSALMRLMSAAPREVAANAIRVSFAYSPEKEKEFAGVA